MERTRPSGLNLNRLVASAALRPLVVVLWWHPRFDADPAHQRLGDQIKDACSPKRSK